MVPSSIIIVVLVAIFASIDCDICLFARDMLENNTVYQDKVVWITGASSGRLPSL
jgi:hypothetical protein